MATSNNSSFVFYESFLKSVQNVERFRGKEEAFDFAMSIIEYGCYGLPPEDTNPAWLYGFEQVRASIDAAQDRRQKQIAQGKMGGRPRKSANIDEILQMRANGLSIRAIAEQLNISDKTVRRRLQEHENDGNFISEQELKSPNKNADAPQDKTPSTSFVPQFHFEDVEKSPSAPVPISSDNAPSNLQLNFNSPNGTKPPCEVLTAQWDIRGQRSFVPIDVEKNNTILSEPSKYNCKNDDEWDKRTKVDKTGQNLNVNVNVNVNENDNNFLGGCAACPIEGTKTTVERDKTGTKPPDKFCPTMGQNLRNDFCLDELDKTQRQNWDKNGQNYSEEFCPDERKKFPVVKMDKNGQNYNDRFCPTDGQNSTTVNRDKNGQNPTTMFCPNIISRAEAEELVATSRENLYISGNKVLCEDDDREWLIL